MGNDPNSKTDPYGLEEISIKVILEVEYPEYRVLPPTIDDIARAGSRYDYAPNPVYRNQLVRPRLKKEELPPADGIELPRVTQRETKRRFFGEANVLFYTIDELRRMGASESSIFYIEAGCWTHVGDDEDLWGQLGLSIELDGTKMTYGNTMAIEFIELKDSNVTWYAIPKWVSYERNGKSGQLLAGYWYVEDFDKVRRYHAMWRNLYFGGQTLMNQLVVGGAAIGPPAGFSQFAGFPRFRSFGPNVCPQGLNQAQLNQAGATIRQATGHLGDDVVAHGSRVQGKANAASDIDFAIRLPEQEFAAFVRARFGTPNPGSAAERTMQMAMQNGRVHAGEAGLRGVRTQLQKQLGIDVDIAVIRRGGPFDQGPSIPVPGGN